MLLWAIALLFAFALLQWAAGTAIEGAGDHPGFATDLYFSGTTMFTLGLGDDHPVSAVARFLTVVQAGTGLAFLALVVSYVPVLYQAFSRRETHISLLDGRAGTPPTASELLRRHADSVGDLAVIFHEWEEWAAELLENHLSYPLLGYFRSQHDNQFWVSALVAIMDACAICQAGLEGAPARQAQLTFAMSRHALVDLAQVFNTPPKPDTQRLADGDLQRLREVLTAAGMRLATDDRFPCRLNELRAMYEPYAEALADYFLISLPPWVRPADAHDNWRTSRWGIGTTV